MTTHIREREGRTKDQVGDQEYVRGKMTWGGGQSGLEGSEPWGNWQQRADEMSCAQGSVCSWLLAVSVTNVLLCLCLCLAGYASNRH